MTLTTIKNGRITPRTINMVPKIIIRVGVNHLIYTTSILPGDRAQVQIQAVPLRRINLA